MNEPFDAELSKAFKESSKSLQGWEFTPQMRQKVLDRVRADEQAGPASTERPVKRAKPTSLVRPLSWVAVAAAAAFLMMRIDLGGFGGLTKNADKADSTKIAGQADQAPGIASLEADKMGIARASADEGPVVILTLPQEMRAKDSLREGTAPPTTTMLAAAQVSISLSDAMVSGQAVELNSRGARAVDQAGFQLWERPLAGVSEKSLLAVAPTGMSAVTAGRDLHILDASGNIKHTVKLGGEPLDLAWSREGLLAVADEQAVNVYKDGNVQFTKAGPEKADLAFNTAGELAVYGAEGGELAVRLYDRAGSELMSVKPAADGAGLVATEQAVVAGAQAYGRKGEPLWQLSIHPEGMVAVDMTPLLVAWDLYSVTAVDANDGQVRWRAVWAEDPNLVLRKAVPSADGRYVVLLAASETGGAVWVLDLSGQVILAEALKAAPLGAAISDGHMLLLMPDGIETRKLP